MKRTNITFDDDTYEYLRKKSFEDRKSMAEILRDMVREKMTPEKKPKGTLKDPYPSVGAPKSSKDYFNSNPEKKPQIFVKIEPLENEVTKEFNPQPKKGKKK